MKTLGRRCINVIHMFCVFWEKISTTSLQIRQKRVSTYLLTFSRYRACNENASTVLLTWLMSTQQTQNICIAFVQCWSNVEDVGPTLYKCYTNVLCFLGKYINHWSANKARNVSLPPPSVDLTYSHIAV